MQTQYRYTIASGYQDALLVELNTVFEAIELALAEGYKGGFVLQDGLECDSRLLAPLVGVEEALLGVLVPLGLRRATQVGHATRLLLLLLLLHLQGAWVGHHHDFALLVGVKRVQTTTCLRLMLKFGLVVDIAGWTAGWQPLRLISTVLPCIERANMPLAVNR